MRQQRRAGRAGASPIVLRHRQAVPGATTVCAVHPGSLPVGVWGHLADALPQDTGLTVLDLAGVPEYFEAALSGDHADLSIASLADRLTAAYRADREGPPQSPAPVFVGWSFGGVLAQAVIERLAPEERPDRLVLVDSIAPTDAYQQPDDALDVPLLLRWFAMYLGAKRSRDLSTCFDSMGTDDLATGLELLLDAAVTSGALPPDTPPPGLRKLYDTYVEGLLRNNRLTAGHRPPVSSVPLVLIKAERSLIPQDKTLGWTELARHGLSLHAAPGDHYTTLTRPDAAEVIAELSGRR
ncbi:thioesterase domain-containing protein [Streptomyces coffeae]|uniref:Alpha/beta hydrolase n=1 Tax=Streptomyces coffeae TaxID=621382 RepID=A0ABS1NQ91_9ACTN|nr:alpha/beta fold hydrolase [Streptomyces coffeae]MBL1102119.1 alpha/beta hydrolase [Streptomyces coffeae]